MRAETVGSPAAVTVIDAVPVPIALTTPLLVTVATPGWLVDQVYGPIDRVEFRVSCADCPGESESVAGVTLKLALPDRVPMAAVSGSSRSSQPPARASAANPSTASVFCLMQHMEALCVHVRGGLGITRWTEYLGRKRPGRQRHLNSRGGAVARRCGGPRFRATIDERQDVSDRDQIAGRDLAAVEARLRDMRQRKNVRWTMSQQTAEMAIAALALERSAAANRRKPAKSRRRKKGKRLL